MSDALLSAELVIEEKIDYNDLVNLIEDGKTSSLDNVINSPVGGNKDESKAGKFFKMIACVMSYSSVVRFCDFCCVCQQWLTM